MSDFHQRAIEDVAREMGRSPGRLSYAIKNGGLGVKAKELAYAVAQRERVLELEEAVLKSRRLNRLGEITEDARGASEPEKVQP